MRTGSRSYGLKSEEEDMFFLVFAGLFVLVSVGCFVRYNMATTHTDWNIGAGFFLTFSIITVCFALIASGIGWAGQVDDIENIKKFQQVEVIYQKKAEALTTEFAKHLADAYPKHEREIFEKISPDKVSWYFSKYPELRSSETLMALVKEINKLQSDVYNQQIAVEQMRQNIRFRLRNPWFFTFMIPAS